VKLATVEIGGGGRVAVVEEGRATRLLPESAGSLLDIVERQTSLGGLLKDATSVWGPARIAAPIGRPRRNIFCVGKNYHEHAQEFAKSGFDSSAAPDAPTGAIPEAPIVF